MSEERIWAQIARTEPEKQICFAIRETVFVKGQDVPPEEEWDDLDNQPEICPHFIAWHLDTQGQRTPIGAARLWLHQEDCAKAQRVAVLASWRKKGVGRTLMDIMEDYTQKTGRQTVILGAQTHAIPFYERIGYEAYGPEYLDAGIPHRDMKKKL